ncbi:MAG TPA: hypothetical protein PLX39_15360 [Pyrinomonadaceae bacterium]|mgnify:CR=1 FL=1|nr:hypothetical protein [Pyrinomonadaceae bacterium]
MKPRSLPPDPKDRRPKTLAEAKALIAKTFREQGWNEREQATYCRIHGADPETQEGCRKLIDAMSASRMILF